MANREKKIKKLVLTRRFFQALFLGLFVYLTIHPLKSILPADTFFKIDPLMSIFTSISGRFILGGIVFSIAMLFLTLIFGRFFCGWLCPLGAIIDICGVSSKNRSFNFRQVKYYIFAIIVIFSFIGIQIAWIFDPMVIMARFVLLTLNPLFIFFILICALSFITKRFWCRALCPLAAFYALIARFSILKRSVEKCAKCFECKAKCRMDAIKEDLSYRKEECILCMDCIYTCPTNGTKFTFTTERNLLGRDD